MRLLILIILIFFKAPSFGQISKDTIEFSVYFTECFKSDTLSLVLNNVSIFKNKIITTDLSDGITNAYLYQTEKGMWIGQKKVSKLKTKKTLSFSILINGSLENIEIDLKKGKYILFDKCNNKSNISKHKIFNIAQRQMQPEFD